MTARPLATIGCIAFVVELVLVLTIGWFGSWTLAMIAVALAFVTRLFCRAVAGPVQLDQTS
jgi:ABC-type proline/glycine betaine transport system permease subunit